MRGSESHRPVQLESILQELRELDGAARDFAQGRPGARPVTLLALEKRVRALRRPLTDLQLCARRAVEIRHSTIPPGGDSEAATQEDGMDDGDGEPAPNAQHAAALLSHLHGALATASAAHLPSTACYATLLARTMRPYLDMLHTFLDQGLCEDPRAEFLIERDPLIDEASPLFWPRGLRLRRGGAPSFLRPLAARILLAGKSARALRALEHQQQQQQQQQRSAPDGTGAGARVGLPVRAGSLLPHRAGSLAAAGPSQRAPALGRAASAAASGAAVSSPASSAAGAAAAAEGALASLPTRGPLPAAEPTAAPHTSPVPAVEAAAAPAVAALASPGSVRAPSVPGRAQWAPAVAPPRLSSPARRLRSRRGVVRRASALSSSSGTSLEASVEAASGLAALEQVAASTLSDPETSSDDAGDEWNVISDEEGADAADSFSSAFSTSVAGLGPLRLRPFGRIADDVRHADADHVFGSEVIVLDVLPRPIADHVLVAPPSCIPPPAPPPPPPIELPLATERDPVADLLVDRVLAEHVSRAYEHACPALVRRLVHDHDLMGHLQCVRWYVLMAAGDAMHTFFTALFEQAEKRELPYYSSQLTEMLREAIRSSAHARYEAHLSVVLDNEDAAEPAAFTPDPGALDAFDRLRFVYTVPPPMDTLLNADALQRYNELARLLLHVRRAKHALERIPVPRDTRERTVRTLYFVRAKLLSFVNNLHNYFMTRVVLGVWSEFEPRLTHAADFDALCALHQEYLLKLRDRALLNPSAAVVRDAIERILALALKLRTIYSELEQGVRSDRFRAEAQLEHIDADFARVHRFLLTILHNFLQKRSQAFLEDILLRINFNGFYSL